MGFVVMWARMPPPPGGVTRANAAMSQALARHYPVTVVGGSLRSVVRGLRKIATAGRPEMQVLSMSVPTRMLTMAPLLLLSPRRVLVVLHGAAGVDEVLAGGGLKNRLTVRILRAVGRVWVNNDAVARNLAAAGIQAEVVSPYCGVATAAVRGDRDGGYRILVAEGNNNPLYNAELVFELGERLRAGGAEVEILLLNYGPRARRRVVPVFVRQVMNADEATVAGAIDWANVLIRPTTTDGDSMLVREAVAAGLRVVASDIVPRPTGVERFSLARGDLCEVVVHGGRRSDGAGLGCSIDEALSRSVAPSSSALGA